MIALDATNRKFIEIDIAELVYALYRSWLIKFSVIVFLSCVPLLADRLICCHILHKLIVH